MSYIYRRGSIFWALTLITIGALFLYHNFNPAIRPWHLIAKFWPVMIIFWGLSKLIDYLQSQAHPEKAAPPLFSGSEVVLLVLILLLGTAVSKFVLGSWARDWGITINDEDFPSLFLDSFTSTETVSQAVGTQPHIVLEDQRGDLEIRAADLSSIEVTAKKVVRAESEASAKKLAEAFKVEVVREGDRCFLRTNRRSLPEGAGRVRMNLALRVPRSASVEVVQERGDLVLEGLRGGGKVTSRHGDVRVSGLEGLLRIQKAGGRTEVSGVKGDVDLDGRGEDVDIFNVAGNVTVNGDFSGSMQFRNIGQTLRYRSSRTDLTLQRLTGRLSMDLGSLEARGIDGPFDLSTRHKDIIVEEFRHRVKITNTNGYIQLRAGLPPAHPVTVDLKKGDIELGLPPNCSFQIEASSRHGEVESDFSGPNLTLSKEGKGPSITGSYGKGGTPIRLTTAYGTIRLTRIVPSSGSAPSGDGGKRVSTRPSKALAFTTCSPKSRA